MAHNQQLDLYLNIALDGYGETHDRIVAFRVTGKRRSIASTHLPAEGKVRARFRLNVNTVVCAENYKKSRCCQSISGRASRLDGQYFNIVRGETLAGDEIKQVPPKILPAMYAHVSKLTKRYGDRMFAEDDATRRFVKNAAYVGAITTHYARSTATS